MKKFFNEITISVAFLVLLILFLDPFMLWMPTSGVYMLIAGLIVVFALFAGFFWKESVQDEREALHRMVAGRFGYLAGASVLVAGIIVEAFSAHIDPWLVAALGAMVVGKLIGRFYSNKHN